MALPLKSGADLYNNQALRMRLHNLGADPTEVGAGLIYFNTSTGLNTSQKARLYTGSAWKTIAFSEDLDVASNADFLALKDKVDTLIGDGVDMDGIIESWKEVEAFLSGMSDTKSLMDYLNTELGKKLDLTGGTLCDSSTDTPLKIRGNDTGAFIAFASLYEYFGYIGAKSDKKPYFYVSGKSYEILTSAGGTIEIDNLQGLIVNRTNGYNSAITFKGNKSTSDSTNSILGYLGFSGFNNPCYFSADGTGNTLLHSGNVGKYALKNYDNQGATNFNEVFYNGIQYAGSGSSNTPLKDAVLVSFFIYDSSWQIIGGRNSNKLMFRSGTKSPSEWNDWKTIAFTDSNITGSVLNSDGDLLLTYSDGLLLGYGSATKSKNTIIYGNSVVVRYSSNRTQGFILNSSGNVTIGASDLAGTDAKLYVDGSVTMKKQGDGAELLRFGTERPWHFIQKGTGSGTSLMLSTTQDNKTFEIGDVNNKSIIQFYASSTTPVVYVDAQLLPLTNNAHRLGSNVARWSTIYGVNGNFSGNMTIDGDLHVKGNIIADGEVSAGGRAEEGGNAGGGGAFHSDTIKVDTTQKTITHGLGTDDIVVSIYEKDGVSGRWSIILTDVEIVDANNIIVSFGSATSVEHKVVIMGAVA